LYEVPQFREESLDVQHALIRDNPLGLLISIAPEGMLANPIPFLLDDAGALGTIGCHLSRGNPQWHALRERPETLVVFQGVDRYITPSWYAQKAVDHKVVPTWNYAMVQVRGHARIITDADWLLGNVSALADAHESRRRRPWSVADAPQGFIASQLKGIVGVEIVIETIAGKFKASQNRPVADRRGVAEGLEAEGDAAALAMRDLVKARGSV
jgi:transcriptional regulator